MIEQPKLFLCDLHRCPQGIREARNQLSSHAQAMDNEAADRHPDYGRPWNKRCRTNQRETDHYQNATGNGCRLKKHILIHNVEAPGNSLHSKKICKL